MKTIVYIDGQNFLYRAAEVLISKNIISDKQDLTDINIRWLLERIFPDDELKIKFYGVSKIQRNKNMDESIRMKSYRFADTLRRIRSSLAKQDIEFIASGILIARDIEPCEVCGFHKVHFMEKGVDVGIAVDFVDDAVARNADKFVIVSSDRDLLPAVSIARYRHGSRVEYVGFENSVNMSIVSKTDASYSIKNIDVVRSFLEKYNVHIDNYDNKDVK